jgi:thiamine-monophosphate kinase
MTRKPKLSEKELLESFARMIRAKKTGARGIVVGVGDDAAVLRSKPHEDMVVTTDILVENQHFRRRWFSGFELGWRLAAVNLSDIAAMGGRPYYGILSLALPPRLQTDYINGVERGVRDHLAKYGAAIVGGNVSGIQTDMVCDLTLIGGCARDQAWRRTCRSGRDAIVVAGRLGEARAGLDLLLRGVRPRFAAPLIRAFKRPEPRLDVSELFRTGVGQIRGHARRRRVDRLVHGAIDISDGLSVDLISLCKEGNAGCEIDVPALPVSPHLKAYCAKYNENPVDVILTGGEDYGLILAVDARRAAGVAKRIRSSLRVPASVIGRFTRNAGVCELVDERGRRKPFVPRGWDHLRGRR